MDTKFANNLNNQNIRKHEFAICPFYYVKEWDNYGKNKTSHRTIKRTNNLSHFHYINDCIGKNEHKICKQSKTIKMYEKMSLQFLSNFIYVK